MQQEGGHLQARKSSLTRARTPMDLDPRHSSLQDCKAIKACCVAVPAALLCFVLWQPKENEADLNN